MPLHVDRSTISFDQAQRREWSIERNARGTAAAPARPAADESAVDVSGLGASSHHVELKRFDQAEALVRQLLETGSGLHGLHPDLDAARVTQLISD